MKSFLCNLIFFSVVTAQLAHAENHPWNLPTSLTDANTEIRFEVDSTWHLVKGTTKNIQGRAWLNNPLDPTSIRAELTLPILGFNTDNSKRDRRMLEVMHAEQYPDIKFEIVAVPKICAPADLETTLSCPATIETRITINNTSQPLTLPATINKNGSTYTVRGTISLKWADFGVEDPSIFVAKLASLVTINFSVELSPQ